MTVALRPRSGKGFRGFGTNAVDVDKKRRGASRPDRKRGVVSCRGAAGVVAAAATTVWVTIVVGWVLALVVP